MAKHYKKVNPKKYIIFILQLIFWVMLLYSLTNIIKWYIYNKQNEEIMEEISDAIVIEEIDEGVDENIETVEESYKINFEELKKMNTDTAAFLKVNGTKIEYPIVKTTNNDYYLNHSFNKTYNAAGWIFADYRNKIDSTDKNVIIYGHNRKNGTMFSSLKNILNKQWYTNEENLKISLITENEEFKYKVFSVYQIEKESY